MINTYSAGTTQNVDKQSGVWRTIRGNPVTAFITILLPIIGAIFWVLTYFQTELAAINLSPKNLIALAAVVLGLAAFSILFLIAGYFFQPIQKSHGVEILADALGVSNIVKAELSRTSKLRVFASNGSSVKAIFIQYLKSGGAINGKIDVEILFRKMPGDSGRDIDLARQIERWNLDVVGATSYTIKTSIAYYALPLMLCGYIFDDRVALLSWYSRPGGTRYRSPADPPMLHLSSSSEQEKKIISQAISTFDCHFKAGTP